MDIMHWSSRSRLTCWKSLRPFRARWVKLWSVWGHLGLDLSQWSSQRPSWTSLRQKQIATLDNWKNADLNVAECWPSGANIQPHLVRLSIFSGGAWMECGQVARAIDPCWPQGSVGIHPGGAQMQRNPWPLRLTFGLRSVTRDPCVQDEAAGVIDDEADATGGSKSHLPVKLRWPELTGTN